MIFKSLYSETYRSGVASVFVADENVGPKYIGFIMSPPLNDIITLKASQLQEAGITQRFIKSKFLRGVEFKPEEIGPQVLTLQHLKTGFVMIFCLLASSVAVFAVEIAPKLARMFWAWLRIGIFFYVVLKVRKLNKLV
jgi:hypothetical protein